MKVAGRIGTALVVLLLWAAAAGTAQGRPQTREGFWIGFGLGGGSLSPSGSAAPDLANQCVSIDFESATGGSGYLRLGGTLSPKLLIAGETTGWLGTVTTNVDVGTPLTGDADFTQGYVGAAVYFYPMETGGLWLRGGVGYAFASGSFKEGDLGTGEVEWSGFGIPIGAGYDIRVGRNVSIVPGVVVLFTTGGDLKVKDAGETCQRTDRISGIAAHLFVRTVLSFRTDDEVYL